MDLLAAGISPRPTDDGLLLDTLSLETVSSFTTSSAAGFFPLAAMLLEVVWAEPEDDDEKLELERGVVSSSDGVIGWLSSWETI